MSGLSAIVGTHTSGDERPQLCRLRTVHFQAKIGVFVSIPKIHPRKAPPLRGLLRNSRFATNLALDGGEQTRLSRHSVAICVCSGRFVLALGVMVVDQAILVARFML